MLERTKEIGILRSLGARKKDITHVFDAETFILGLCSGLLGVAIAWLLTFPINSIIASMASLENVAHLQPLHALILVAISTILTMLGGHIPARMASRTVSYTHLIVCVQTPEAAVYRLQNMLLGKIEHHPGADTALGL